MLHSQSRRFEAAMHVANVRLRPETSNRAYLGTLGFTRCKYKELGREGSIIDLQFCKSGSMSRDHLSHTTVFGVELNGAGYTPIVLVDTIEYHPLLIQRHAVIDNLAASQMCIHFKYTLRLPVVFNFQ